MNRKVCHQHLPVISLDLNHHPTELCREQNGLLHSWEEPIPQSAAVALAAHRAACFVIEGGGKLKFIFICLMSHYHAAFVTSRHGGARETGGALGRPARLSPRRDRLRRFLGAAGGAQDLEHVGERAPVGGLGDEDGAAHQEHQEGDPEARGGDDVAEVEAEILLDVGHAPQRQDGPQVDAPVEPVEESARRLWSSVFDLKNTE